MKIFSINISNSKKNQQSIKNNKFNSYFGFDKNIKLKTLQNDTISFGSKNKNKVPLIQDGQTLGYHRVYNELKNIPNLPCVYCGEPMLSVPNRKRIIAELSSQCGEELINTIQKNKNFFREHKANVAEKIIKIAQKHPEDNIEEIFKKLAPQYRTELEKEQLEVIRRINTIYGKSFPSEAEKRLFQNILYETNQWITNKDEEEPFKRKAFLEELKRILNLPIFSNKQLTKKILLEADSLPQSTESENAFVVKYHRRKAKEIAELLLYEPMSTIEHIKPQDVGGQTVPQNLAVACAHCNNLVRKNMRMDKFVDLHPEINKNLRRNFDAILNYSNKQNKALYKKLSEKNINNENYQRYVQAIKENEDYKNYIKAIAQTYMRESKGKLDLNKYIQIN